LADYLIELMISSWALVDEPVDLVIPVPLHWQRGWQRGFNQAEILARGVARRLGVETADPLVRQRSTQPQFRLAKAIRLSNIQGAFSLKERYQAIISGRVILVVDDVVATGSTIEECAKILKQKGAKQVWGLVIARA
jgi:ComF family protein